MTAKLQVTSDERSLAVAGADIVSDVVRAVPNAVVTFATGQSAMPIYRALAERVGRGERGEASRPVLACREYDQALDRAGDDPGVLSEPVGRRYLSDRPADGLATRGDARGDGPKPP